MGRASRIKRERRVLREAERVGGPEALNAYIRPLFAKRIESAPRSERRRAFAIIWPSWAAAWKE